MKTMTDAEESDRKPEPPKGWLERLKEKFTKHPDDVPMPEYLKHGVVKTRRDFRTAPLRAETRQELAEAYAIAAQIYQAGFAVEKKFGISPGDSAFHDGRFEVGYSAVMLQHPDFSTGIGANHRMIAQMDQAPKIMQSLSKAIGTLIETHPDDKDVSALSTMWENAAKQFEKAGVEAEKLREAAFPKKKGPSR
jgi:predicted nuclease with RNAse H fold